jgi:predicted metal-dependent phosphotriesterase family hydrolase
MAGKKISDMPFVRTVLGDILPEEMGMTFSHEHIVIEESFPTLTNPDFVLNDDEKIISELTAFHYSGGRTMVDTMPANCGRGILRLAAVSLASHVNIIAPTGIHLEKYYPPNHWRYYLNENELTDLFIADITDGIDALDYGSPVIKRTSHKAGLIKLATGDEPISAHQQKIFNAVVHAHRETGAPILTHTNSGKNAIEQVEHFVALGADPAHIVLSHVDRRQDMGWHKSLLQTGVFVEYDSHFRYDNSNTNFTYQLLETFLPSHPNQIVLGMDMARSTYWSSYGGKPGLNYLFNIMIPWLRSNGWEQMIQKIFVDNPRSLFQFAKAQIT